MSKIRPYLSLDLETTGLNVEKVQILQVGMVIDDGISPIEHLQKISFFVKNDVLTYGEDYAIGMNAWIFQELMKKADERKYPALGLNDTFAEIAKAIQLTSQLAKAFEINNGKERPNQRVQIAGKNAGVFDWPIVLNNHRRSPTTSGFLEDVLKRVDHKFIDVGDLYYTDFGMNPGFDKIQELIGQPKITHDALGDALAVVIAIRHKMGVPCSP
jgi:hypothetical protein